MGALIAGAPLLRLPFVQKNTHVWCGPYIVALLLGVDYAEAYRLLLADARLFRRMAVHVEADRSQTIATPDDVRRVVQPVRITGTYPHQVARLLTKRGVRCRMNEAEGSPTVLSFIRNNAKPGRAYLIDAADHWIVVMDGVMYNSLFKPVPLEKAKRYRLARVLYWAEVKPRPEAFA